MRTLMLLCTLFFGIFSSGLYAQTAVSENDFLEVTCTIIDSTGTSKDMYVVNEPATYVLAIRNISDFPITYKYSSENSSLFAVDVKSYYMVDNNGSSLSPYVIDAEGVLEAGEVLRDTKTVYMDEVGKYEFVIFPNFNFPKQYWPSTGPLYRVFDVVSAQAEE